MQEGKKKIKAVTRALRNVNQTPALGGRRRPSDLTPRPARLTFTNYDFTPRNRTASNKERPQNAKPSGGISVRDALQQNTSMFTETPPNIPAHSDGQAEHTSLQDSPAQHAARRQSTASVASSPRSLSPTSKPIEDIEPSEPSTRPEISRVQSKTTFMASPPIRIPEKQPLKGPYGDLGLSRAGITRYGSIIGSPPQQENPLGMPSLELPDPAMSNPDTRSRRAQGSWNISAPWTGVSAQNPSSSTDPYQVGETHVPHKSLSIGLPRHLFQSKRALSTPVGNANTSRPLGKRLFSATPIQSPQPSDMQLNAYRELDARQEEFFAFLDKELDKVESFYKMKEQEATHRLYILRDQLHEMRDRRMQEILAAKSHENEHSDGVLAHLLPNGENEQNGNSRKTSFFKPLKPVEVALRRGSHIGKTSKAMEQLGSPGKKQQGIPEDQQDYTRRKTENEHVPYRTAKRKLKLALQEFHRGLELLKSYAMLNRTGFRKINKKYDKAVNARPTGRYMSEKVNKAWFVQSDVLDGHIVAVEDLYARYFERGNHKIAVSKLRSYAKAGHYSSNAFRNGLLIAGGLIFGIHGIVYGADYLRSPDPRVAVQSSYLFQLYAGYFLALLLFLCFVLACRLWTMAKVNYVFIFEYDTRHVLDWRQLAELPCLFAFLNGLFLWLNFRPGLSDSMFLYWPVVLIGLTLLIMCLPLPILYPNARKWWAYSNWRLLLAGLYPVEFRDFFLGDMYCSQTYTMGNIGLFFCLYAQDWRNPPQCNSSHSRLLGFFSTLPAIWRAFQCLRRYYDSRNWFPHLANCAKYMCNILYYMTLSLYRIDETSRLRGLFIFFALINATYCSFWDVAMDWSLGNPYARYPFLRDNLAYRRIWMYYVAMVLDPILRFQWILYAIYAHDLQHSTLVSFFVALAEVFRRGMWTIFRVENEHCNNVGRFRASRDIPLPYSLPESPRESQEIPHPSDGQVPTPSPVTGADVERVAETTPGSSLRLRRTRTPAATPVEMAMRRAGTIIGTAHAQDYEKKKRPGVVGDSPNMGGGGVDGDGSSDEEEEGEASDGEMSGHDEELMEAQKVVSRSHNG
jgi:xenotropic and polytropic retrovirus receptor 1